MADVSPERLIREFLLLGLRFDRIQDGYVDSFTGDPALRAQVADEPAPDPADLARTARTLLAELPSVPREDGFTELRAEYLRAHLVALECAARKFTGEQVGFVDEVRAYFDVQIGPGDPQHYADAHRALEAALGGTGPLAERVADYRRSTEIPPERLANGDVAATSLLDVDGSSPVPPGLGPHALRHATAAPHRNGIAGIVTFIKSQYPQM